MRNIMLATKNPGKLAEFSHLLSGIAEVHSLTEFPEIALPAETGTSYEENARLKAAHVAAVLHMPALADDSGLEVEALPGELGVYSARYMQGSDQDRVQKLLQALAHEESRRAKFVAVLALVLPNDPNCHLFRGELLGKISQKAIGQFGFGYDPIFIPDGFDRTLAQLTAEEKNGISHRAVAAEHLKHWLQAQPEW